MTKYVVAVRYTVKPGMRDELMKIARVNVEHTRKEKGNICYTHYPSPDNDDEVFVYEEWERYGDLIAHSHAQHYLDFSEQRKPMLVEGSYYYTVYTAEVRDEGGKVATW